jgi:hypothetical protein
MMSFWRRNKELLWLIIAMIIAFAFSIAMIATNAFLINVGFLVLGALLAIFISILSEAIKRPAQARDLARALYEELADRVARCCFDFEIPWQTYLDTENPSGGAMSSLRLRKFSPEPPIIFPSTASQLAILGNDAPQALIRFYYCLAAWKRDVVNFADDNESALSREALCFLAQRLRQTLTPGLRALQALAPLVEEHGRIEMAAIAGYDEIRGNSQSTITLRERIDRLIA